MNIAVDLGNTHAKLGVFQSGKLIRHEYDVPLDGLADYLNNEDPKNIIISSVNQDPGPIKKGLASDINCIILDANTPLPIKIAYQTPHTLGVDRIAAVVGAYVLSPNTNTLIIDAGTCITYEFLDSGNNYHGGAISPGIHLKFRALNNFTANLPLINDVAMVPLVGESTENAIKSGVINGTIAEIQEIIRMYCDKFGNLRIIMCGGDAKFFENKIITPIFVAPELVLVGLNGIIDYNV